MDNKSLDEIVKEIKDIKTKLGTIENKLERIGKTISLTENERVILDNIPYNYKYIVRDKTGLYVFETAPYFVGNDYIFHDANNEYKSLDVFSHMFQFIKVGTGYEIDYLLGE